MTIDRMHGETAQSSFTHHLELRDFLIVCIGDSSASGQGNPDLPGRPAGFDPDIHWYDLLIPGAIAYKISKEALSHIGDYLTKHETQLARAGGLSIEMDPSPVWQEPRAQRSLRGSHAFAAKLSEDLSDGRVVTYLGFGRTGSEIEDGLIGPRTSDGHSIDDWANDRGQVSEIISAIGARRIDALVLQIGINDVGVSSTLSDLVKGDLALRMDNSEATRVRLEVERRARERLDALPSLFDRLAVVLKQLDVDRIYLVEYPASLFDGPTGEPRRGCEVFNGPKLDLSLRDAELVKAIAQGLNRKLAGIAGAHRWIFVSGVEAAFEKHGYCRASAERWFRTCSESLILQGDTEGTIHPDSKGQTAVGRIIARHLQEHTFGPPLIDPSSAEGKQSAHAGRESRSAS